MCGIAGIAGFEDKSQARAPIARMAERLAHRGPDALGSEVFDGCAFGHARLSIIDLSAAANQPMRDASNRFIITFNGEIYNYREVRAKLPDYDFRTNSDTETILAAYERFGADSLPMLNGMFALAIWDRERHELFLARDRFGVKPLYYALRDGVLYFSSEIRSLLASGAVERSVDRAALRDYLAFQSVYSPATIVSDVRQLPAGSCAAYSNGRLDIRPYWSIDAFPAPIEERTEPEIRERVLGLLQKSIERRMVSDVRVGAFLSGGIDSSAVVALMAEASPAPVHTFSVGFEEPEYDESKYSAEIAAAYGTEHTSIRLRATDFLEQLPAALAAADSPSGDGVNTYVVSKATREAGLKVALSGIGGDELFAGYPNFLNWTRYRESFLARGPRVLRRTAGAVLARAAGSKTQRIGSLLAAPGAGIADFYPRTRQILSDRTLAALLPDIDSEPEIVRELSARAEAIGEFPALSQFSIAELLGYTQNVLLKDADQFSMASALEVREPFFDHELVGYVLRIPDRWKHPSYPKKLLVESLAPRLPDSIVHRPKMGFVLPWDQWMRSDLRDFCEARIESVASAGLVDPTATTRLWSDFLERRSGVLWSHVWHLVVLAEWLANNRFTK